MKFLAARRRGVVLALALFAFSGSTAWGAGTAQEQNQSKLDTQNGAPVQETKATTKAATTKPTVKAKSKKTYKKKATVKRKVKPVAKTAPPVPTESATAVAVPVAPAGNSSANVLPVPVPAATFAAGAAAAGVTTAPSAPLVATVSPLPVVAAPTPAQVPAAVQAPAFSWGDSINEPAQKEAAPAEPAPQQPAVRNPYSPPKGNPYLAYTYEPAPPPAAAPAAPVITNGIPTIRSIWPEDGPSLLPKIKRVYPTGEKPLVVVTFKCPTELIGVTPLPTKLLHDLVDFGMESLNASDLLDFNLQQVCQ